MFVLKCITFSYIITLPLLHPGHLRLMQQVLSNIKSLFKFSQLTSNILYTDSVFFLLQSRSQARVKPCTQLLQAFLSSLPFKVLTTELDLQVKFFLEADLLHVIIWMSHPTPKQHVQNELNFVKFEIYFLLLYSQLSELYHSNVA